MTTATFKYLDRASIRPHEKPWAKVDGPGNSFTLKDHHSVPVTNLRTIPDHSETFTTDTSGFSLHTFPSSETAFTDPSAIQSTYYADTEAALRRHLPSGSKVRKVVIFDHTIRKHDPTSPRQPVQQVHVDQTPRAAETRVRRHLEAAEADELLKGRYQIINVWRPISHPASDYPLALIDARTTQPEDFVKVDLMYPVGNGKGEDRGKEALPDASSRDSTVGYQVKGETLVVAPSEGHRFYYVKDMGTEEVVFLKCFDSRGQFMNDEGYVSGEEEVKVVGKGEGRDGVAMGTPHTAFIDPQTPKGVKGRESIEVRCLVFYDD
jgi:hypothetical protein